MITIFFSILIFTAICSISFTVIYIYHTTNTKEIKKALSELENSIDQSAKSEENQDKVDELQGTIIIKKQLRKLSFNQAILCILYTIILLLIGIFYLLYTIVDNLALL